MMSIHRKIEDYPVFAKAGAIIPMQTAYQLEAGADLEVLIFPGASNQFVLYEDAGDGDAFEHGEFAQTQMSLHWSKETEFLVEPASGDLSLLPESRNYQFTLRGFHADTQITPFIDGEKVSAEIRYDRETHSMIVQLAAKVTSQIKLTITGDSLIAENEDLQVRVTRLLQRAQLSNYMKSAIIQLIQKNDMPMQYKLAELSNLCANGIEYHELIEAIIEQLTLIE